MPANEQERRVYKYVLDNAGITTAQAMKLLELKQRRTRENLKKMVETGWLRKEGASRSSIYVKS
jgi:predicted HTH transcriptional regulator